MTGARILFLDIETRPAIVYSFGIRDQHISHKQIKEDGGVICVGMKMSDEKQTRVLSVWEHGWERMVEETHRMISEADAVCGFNSIKFDLPKLMGCFLLAGMAPPPPPTQIDLYLAVRKMGFICNKLDYIAPLLGIGGKVKHEGLDLWIKVMAGDAAAKARMAKYCAGDVKLTEKLYHKVLPYVTNHPHMGTTRADACGACGSRNTQSRGVRRTKASIIARIQCTDCGSWQSGRRQAA